MSRWLLDGFTKPERSFSLGVSAEEVKGVSFWGAREEVRVQEGGGSPHEGCKRNQEARERNVMLVGEQRSRWKES